MNTLTKILATTACTLPLIALAQVTPSDQPGSELQRKQTTETGQATKYGGPGTSTSGDAMSDTSKTKMKHKGMKSDTSKSTNTTPAGDVPTYPAPARDGTPTK